MTQLISDRTKKWLNWSPVDFPWPVRRFHWSLWAFLTVVCTPRGLSVHTATTHGLTGTWVTRSLIYYRCERRQEVGIVAACPRKPTEPSDWDLYLRVYSSIRCDIDTKMQISSSRYVLKINIEYVKYLFRKMQSLQFYWSRHFWVSKMFCHIVEIESLTLR